MAKIVKKAQLGALIRKGVQGAAKAITKAKPAKTLAQKVMDKKLSKDITLASPRLPLAEKKLMQRKAARRKEIEDSYKKNGGPVKKMQSGGKTPTYKNLPMGVSLEEEERSGYRKEGIKPSKQDSAAYKQGYGRGVQGGKGYAGESPIGRMGRWEGQNAKPKAAAPKKKMQAGGVMKPAKRVGPIDPNGAWTKVQERTIAGKKAPKVPLKKDKQLGATKMKMGGKLKKK